MTTHTITILGPGCANCAALEAATRQAVDAVGLDATIDEVTDPVAIAGYGVMSTPGLVVDGTVVSVGRVPTAAQVADLLRDRS
jgi:small redox-active disulfide protein 2